MGIRQTIEEENREAQNILKGYGVDQDGTNKLLFLIYKRLGDIEEILWNTE